jgi:SAM-dependent methyltransferase
MIRLARLNAEKLGFNNVEFREGDLEQMPVSDGAADVVVSNCVLNLVPNKTAVMAEIFRILKPGGHFSISDVVLVGELPQALQTEAEMYAGCVSGAIQKETYLSLMAEAGFQDLEVQKEKPIVIPDDVLSKYVDADGLAAWHHSRTGIFSVTVFGQKPGAQEKQPREELKAAVCAPGSGCC